MPPQDVTIGSVLVQESGRAQLTSLGHYLGRSLHSVLTALAKVPAYPYDKYYSKIERITL
jgi:hypothetical protein